MAKIHIIPHTHWDREWYRTFQYFRVKLVFVIDQIIEILENDETFETFLLDGQSIVLDDYLQIKPENFERIRKLVQDGRLIIGPWYIQPDEFAPDGESLIRNLLLGIGTARKFGEPMMVGYLPDSFGQSGQMPHILRGFGIDSAVMMRGVPSDKIKQSEFSWEGINGDEVLGIYLPDGYSNAMHMPEKYLSFRIRLAYTIQNLRKWSSTENILVLNGVDHQFPQAHISKHVEKLNKGKKSAAYQFSSLKEYIQDVRDANPALPQLKGDLLWPTRNRVHSSIASTRIYQKQENRRMEALLEKYVEPIATIGWLLNAEYPAELINQAWRALLQNQTHDGICGCCTDEVHREMDQRFVDVKNIGETLQNAYARAIARRVSPDKQNLVVFNNALMPGKQLVKASVYTSKSDFCLMNPNGESIPYQIDSIEEVDLSERSIWTLYLNQEEEAYKTNISFYVDFDFNLGCKVFEIKDGKKPQAGERGIMLGDNSLENQYTRLEINPNGTINLLDKATGVTYANLHLFEDCGDAGDTYNYSPVKNDTVVLSEDVDAEIKIEYAGALKSTATIKLEMEVPKSLANQDQERSAEMGTLRIISKITMYADNKRLDFVTEVDNTVLDHRLRVLFPVGFTTDHSFAETQFGTIQRDNELDTKDWEKNKWSEKPLPIYSQQKFVDLNNGEVGLAVLNRGLPEYEIYDRQSSVIALTLVRGVGMMGKGNLLIRPGRPSGISLPTPDAQCAGKQILEYALFSHAGGVDEGNVAQAAAEYDAAPLAVQSHLEFRKILKKYKMLLPLVSYENLTSHIHDQLDQSIETDFEVLTISDEHLIISAVKKAKNEDALIIRLYNASGQVVENASLKFGIYTQSGYLTNLNEEIIEDLVKQNDGTYSLPAIKGYSVLTAKFVFD